MNSNVIYWHSDESSYCNRSSKYFTLQRRAKSEQLAVTDTHPVHNANEDQSPGQALSMNFPSLPDTMPSLLPEHDHNLPRAHMTRIETFPGPSHDAVAAISRKRAGARSTHRKPATLSCQTRASYSRGPRQKRVCKPPAANKAGHIIKQGDGGLGG